MAVFQAVVRRESGMEQLSYQAQSFSYPSAFKGRSTRPRLPVSGQLYQVHTAPTIWQYVEFFHTHRTLASLPSTVAAV